MRTVRTGISHTDALDFIEGCSSEYDLRCWMHCHADDIIYFREEQMDMIMDAFRSQLLIIEARKIVNN